MTSKISRKTPHVLVFTLTVLSAFILGGCATMPLPGDTGEPDSGYLVIIGGGLKKENKAVYDKILELAGGPKASIGILPTASAEPQSSGPSYVEDFITHSGRADVAEVISITTDNPEAADDMAMAGTIRAKTGLFFTGGVQSRVTSVFRPNSIPTFSYLAMRDVLDRGGVIAGTSAGAAMMSDPMIRWGNSEDALLTGAMCTAEDRAVCVIPGMGFFPHGMTGQHFISRGRLGRLIVALESEGIDFGYGVDDNKAMVVDLAEDKMSFLGDRAIFMVDMRDVQRDGLERIGIRLSMLGEGDEVDLATDRANFGGSKRELPTPAKLAPGTLLEESSAWERSAIADGIVMLAREGVKTVELEDKHFKVLLIRDEKTQFAMTGQQEETLSAIDVRLDIVPKDGAIEAAAELRRSLAAMGE